MLTDGQIEKAVAQYARAIRSIPLALGPNPEQQIQNYRKGLLRAREKERRLLRGGEGESGK